MYGATYSYLGDAGFSAEDEYREIFKRLRVVNYRLSDARISTSGTGAVVRATYSYGDKLSKTESGRPWLHTGIVTFHLRDDGEKRRRQEDRRLSAHRHFGDTFNTHDNHRASQYGIETPHPGRIDEEAPSGSG